MYRKIPVLLFLIGISYQINAQFNNNEANKLERAIKILSTQYVDSLDDAKLVKAAIVGMLSELDPHSKYMDQEETKKNNESIYGNFAGVGIQYQILDDTLMVLKVNKEGPAEKSGIKAGDVLLKINDENSTGQSVNNTYFTSHLRGEIGSKVKLTIRHYGSPDTENIEIIRGLIPISTIDAAFMLDSKTGYVKINGFSNTTVDEFRLAAFRLQIYGMENMVLDLRGNPGGVMKAAIDLASMFMDDHKLIVYTQGLHYPKDEYYSKSKGELVNGRLIVLMDEGSASASEIFAGAIQDWDRGLIIGRRSYGKGLVGRSFNLPDATSIRLTTGRYYTPSGRSIQKPYIKGEGEIYRQDLRKRMEHGELYSADSISFPDSLKFRTAAGRLVYGAGAIMPDYFIPLDTGFSSEYFKKLTNNGVLNLFAGKLFKKNFSYYHSNFSTYLIFKSNFNITEGELMDMRKFAEEYYKITTSDSIFDTEKMLYQTYLKAILARNLFDGGDYFQEISFLDKSILKSIELINNRKYFKEMKIQDK